MKKKWVSLFLASAMALSMAACGSEDAGSGNGEESTKKDIPTIDKINKEDYKDLKADIKILTNRTDIVDTKYKEYADAFMKEYPNIKVTYEAITDYEESLTLRLPNGDWGDICFIPSTCEKSEMGVFFTPLGDFQTLDGIYNFVTDKTFDNTVYGIPNGGTAGGVAYNKRIWKEAGALKEDKDGNVVTPKTPDEFLEALKLIKENTSAIPLYTNFSAGWPMGAWNDYVGIACTGDPAHKNNKLLHQREP